MNENMNKIILDLCGGTGSWSKPYKEEGYDVRVITLPEHDVSCYTPPENVYGILAAPPCQQFSFCRTNAKKKRNTKYAMGIVLSCLRIIWCCQHDIEKDTQKRSPLKFWALENPNGMLKWFLGNPVFKFSPYEFGDMYKKNTHLWGYFNNPIKKFKKESAKDLVKFDILKTKEIHPEYYGKLTRKERRAITPKGFAEAFYEANK